MCGKELNNKKSLYCSEICRIKYKSLNEDSWVKIIFEFFINITS